MAPADPPVECPVRLVLFFFLLLEREASFVGKNFSETPSFS